MPNRSSGGGGSLSRNQVEECYALLSFLATRTVKQRRLSRDAIATFRFPVNGDSERTRESTVESLEPGTLVRLVGFGSNCTIRRGAYARQSSNEEPEAMSSIA